MSRGRRIVFGVVAACVVSYAGTGAVAAGLSASVCVVGQGGCTLPGVPAEFTLVLNRTDAEIVAGQFAIQYDPTVLELLSIAPGNTCDPSSPFVLTIFNSVDAATGSIVFAVGTSPFDRGHDPNQPATIACLSFLPRQVTSTSACLVGENHLVSSFLVDGIGQPVFISNGLDCPTNEPEPALSCAPVVIEDACQCTPGTENCATLDAACREGVCDAETDFCTTIPANEGSVCDDGDDCTTNDRCRGGRCVGGDCTNPSLCIDAPGCDDPSGVGQVLIQLGAGEPVIAGGQFSLRYDPLLLRLVDIAPGGACVPDSPFTFEVARIVDEVEGRIFYAAAVSPSGAGGTRGPAVLACATFETVGQPAGDVCLFEGLNPANTSLVGESGHIIVPFNQIDCPATLPAPITACATPVTFCPIPTLSQWGLLVLTILLLIGAKVCFRRRHAREAT